MTSFSLCRLFKGPISKHSHISRYQALGLQHVSLWGHRSAITLTAALLVAQELCGPTVQGQGVQGLLLFR